MIYLFISETEKLKWNESTLKSFSDYRLKKLNSINNKKRLNESFAAEVLLLYGLKKLDNKPIDRLLIEAKNGKPTFCKGFSDYFFSISHSDRLCGVAFSKNDIGFDLQKHTTVSDKAKNKLCPSCSDEEFLMEFTKAEALFKLSGNKFTDCFKKTGAAFFCQGKIQTDNSLYYYSTATNCAEELEIIYVGKR